MDRFIAAVVQMSSRDDKEANLEAAARLIGLAASRGADLVVLPELFNCLGSPEKIVAAAEPIPGPTSEQMAGLAAEHNITLVAGSIAEQSEEPERVYNSSLIFGPGGEQLACYRKIHLFDIDLPGTVTFQESSFMRPGSRVVVTETPLGRIGQATCYDLRFPELFRRLVDDGAEVLVVPSAFTLATGRDHWEPLLRARAIENQCHLLAPDQFGKLSPTIQTYGRSMIVHPWGTILAGVADGEGIAVAEIDLAAQRDIRRRLPALEHRRNIE